MRLKYILLVLLSPLTLFAQQWERVGELSSTDDAGSGLFHLNNRLYFGYTPQYNNKNYDLSSWNGKQWSFIDTSASESTGYVGYADKVNVRDNRMLMEKLHTNGLGATYDSIGIVSFDGEKWQLLYQRSDLPAVKIRQIEQMENKIYFLTQKDTLYNSQNRRMYDIFQFEGTNKKVIPIKLLMESAFDCRMHRIANELYLNVIPHIDNEWANGKPLSILNKWNGTQWIQVGNDEPHNGADHVLMYNNSLVSAGKNYDGLDGNPISSGVQMLVNGNWVSLAGTEMTGEITRLMEHKGELYANERGERLWRYTGIAMDWELIATNQQFKDTAEWPYNKPFYNIIAYKDELYVHGDFQKVNGEEIHDLAKMPLLNDTNSQPNTVNDQATLNQKDSILIPIKSNDTDNNGDYLLTEIITYPKNGAVTVTDGDELFYKPDANFHDLDTLQYKICDRGGLCDSAYVYITVLLVNTLNTFPESNITIYPNPATEYIRIRPEHPVNTAVYSLNTSVYIYDLTGKQVAYTRIQPYTEFTIDISSLKTGVYIIRLISEKGAYQQKLIKQ